ncbi:hypothetical protein BDR05DRAFT_376707 [Suillus weaverae]|nr:hypothetical protein BDR05DRAFT_376707 [Suillus weaverae]
MSHGSSQSYDVLLARTLTNSETHMFPRAISLAQALPLTLALGAIIRYQRLSVASTTWTYNDSITSTLTSLSLNFIRNPDISTPSSPTAHSAHHSAHHRSYFTAPSCPVTWMANLSDSKSSAEIIFKCLLNAYPQAFASPSTLTRGDA